MSHADNKHSLTLQSYITAPYECSYLPQKMALSQVIIPAHLVDTPIYSQLINMGFRRSGLFVYRPACEGCNDCLPIRIPVDAFSPNRNQKRAFQQLKHLQISLLELHDTDEYYALYRQYQKTKHAGGGMDDDSYEDYHAFLASSRVETKILEYREYEGKHNQAQLAPSLEAKLNTQTTLEKGQLRMVSIIDVLKDGISAVYTYYDTSDTKRSYGTYGILWQIDYAKKLGLSYVYLGYWIQKCHKMSYKSHFLPFEIRVENQWQRFDHLPETL